MIEYVLDTNVVAAFMHNDVQVVARARNRGLGTCAIPQPVLAEIEFGVERLLRSKRRDLLEAQLSLVRIALIRIAWTDDISTHFARTKAALERSGGIIEDFDIAIAAHALSLNAVLVSANVKHMSRVPGLRLEDWTR